jgi:hypothetical protein
MEVWENTKHLQKRKKTVNMGDEIKLIVQRKI